MKIPGVQCALLHVAKFPVQLFSDGVHSGVHSCSTQFIQETSGTEHGRFRFHSSLECTGTCTSRYYRTMVHLHVLVCTGKRYTVHL